MGGGEDYLPYRGGRHGEHRGAGTDGSMRKGRPEARHRCAQEQHEPRQNHDQGRNNPLRQADFVEAARAGLDEWRVPGISIAVIDGSASIYAGSDCTGGGGYEIWAEGFGYAALPKRCVAPSSRPAASQNGERTEHGARHVKQTRGEDVGSPATAETLYYTGSTTKAFTAAVLGQIIHPDAAGEKSGTEAAAAASASASAPATYSAKFPKGFRTPVSEVIRDDFVLSDEWATAHVTFEDALSHRTGLARHDKALAEWYPPATSATTDNNSSNRNRDDSNDDVHCNGEKGQERKHRGNVRDYTRLLRYLPLVQEPRVTFRYCNLMFLAVSRALEVVTGRWLGDVMRDWIWEPLGMQSTYFSLQDAQRARPGSLAEGYYWDYMAAAGGDHVHEVESKGAGELRKEKSLYHYIPFMDLSGGSGAGGIVSSVADYALWVRCLLQESGPLSEACHRAITTPRIIMQANVDGSTDKQNGYDGPLSYALGWFAGTYRGHRVYAHSGGMEAYGTEVYFFPDLKFGVVTMANTAVTANCLGAVLAWKLIDDKLEVPQKQRFDWAGRRKAGIAKSLKARDTAMNDYFPRRAQPPLRTPLPLDAYTGTYHHPAYQNLVIIKNGSRAERGLMPTSDAAARRELYAAHHDRVWKMDFEFEHVSGEHWLVFIEFAHSPNRLNQQFAKAEFKIGAAGDVVSVCVEYLEDGAEGVIEYKKLT
ncbi:beta-lactamase/transpeptidase-like protein [Microdochium trichocladiopsis]|uniref:Beta-lactamase/transpeptidase-like protein n=1 Tax=Microdochium trichocladiopsis TaxID=1682393 RepID=A0A9P9BHY6_9PEZI|nr:beta-lactamase/transpeptidase-like protein [Microdochium trichocladiopsis]KAH7021025.1 beta-lactamase/transpeptidase-like protein [Microdochium trichocladiopsis]